MHFVIKENSFPAAFASLRFQCKTIFLKVRLKTAHKACMFIHTKSLIHKFA